MQMDLQWRAQFLSQQFDGFGRHEILRFTMFYACTEQPVNIFPLIACDAAKGKDNGTEANFYRGQTAQVVAKL